MTRRAIFKLAIFLLLGAIINVAVAWGCMVYPRQRLPYPEALTPPNVFEFDDTNIYIVPGRLHVSKMGQGVFVSYVGFPKRVDAETFDSLLPRWSKFRIGDPTVGQRSDEGQALHVIAFSEFASGWPFLTLRGSLLNSYSGDHSTGALALPSWWQSRNLAYGFVPSTPMWPGFAINTIFYAAIVWMMFAVPGAIRRRIRVKRGQCVKCAYDLRGTPDIEKCPECGVTR